MRILIAILDILELRNERLLFRHVCVCFRRFWHKCFLTCARVVWGNSLEAIEYTSVMIYSIISIIRANVGEGGHG